jgi:hypothetical protein
MGPLRQESSFDYAQLESVDRTRDAAASTSEGKTMGRTILGILAGMAVAIVLVMAGDAASAALYPHPPGLDLKQPDQLAAYIAAAPASAMVVMVAGWTLAAFAGGWVAARIARSHRTFAGLMVGALVLAGVIANAMMIPHPLVMIVLGVLLPLPAAWLGTRVARPRGAIA